MNKKKQIVEDDISMQEELKSLLDNTFYEATVLKDFVNAKEIRKESNIPVITKPYNPTILLLRIQNVFKRLNQVIELTKNEMLIFLYLLTDENRIVSRDELMSELWNNEEYINDNTLTVNISRLRSKLASFGYSEAIKTRKGQGYILL